MGKIAFVFAGQGDQYPGMGKDLESMYPAAAQVFQKCDELRPGTSEQCFNGTEEELKETANTQPCLFAMELAAAKVLMTNDVKPDAVAGFSLGEVVASAVAGIVDEETAFKLVCKRGELMQNAAEQFDTSMAAVIKLKEKDVIEMCKKYSNVHPVNFNCPGQITVSGLKAEMKGFAAEIKEIGGRALPLKVKGAFHSPFMNDASEKFREILDTVEFKKSDITLYSNITGMPYGEDAKGTLADQIKSPVQWEKTIRNMIAEGIDTFIEIGPGLTLTNMIKKIDSTVKTYAVSDIETILTEVRQC